MWKRLLVPHDFSDCASHALAVARGLAEESGAEVTLLHVSALPPNLPADARVRPDGARTPVRIDDLATRGALERLEEIAKPLRERGIDVRCVAVARSSGDVVVEILRAAEETSADAVVMGTHGRVGLSHLLLGSVAEHVIRSARIPVVTVRSASPEAAPTREEMLAEDELSG